LKTDRHTETAGAGRNFCASGNLRKVYAAGKNASMPFKGHLATGESVCDD
jgi:hypothetical protein